MEIEELATKLDAHEHNSQKRAEWLMCEIEESKKGKAMSAEEKVIVHNKFEPGHGSDGGGLNAMAAIAALGNRNDSRSNMPYGGDGGFGFGGGGMGAILALALLGRRGLGGDDGNCGDRGGERAVEAIQLSKLGSIEGAIPLAAADVTNNILAQTNALTGAIGTLALGTQQGFANVKDTVQNTTALTLGAIAGTKDAVQNGLFLTNTNLLEGVCSIKQNTDNNADRILAALNTRWTAEDQARIVAQANEIVELRQEGRRRADHDELRIQISNTNTAVAAQQQGQQQAQFQAQGFAINSLLEQVRGLTQIAHATNSNVIAGNTGAVVTGPQTANPTNVNTRG